MEGRLEAGQLWQSSSGGGLHGQVKDLNSAAATTIFASWGSRGNSDIVSPTCLKEEQHNVLFRGAEVG